MLTLASKCLGKFYEYEYEVKNKMWHLKKVQK